MDNDLKKIKKLYGENMMHLCRELFPTLLEEEGLLPNLLTENFNPSKFLYDDLKEQQKEDEFKNYIHSCVDYQKNNLTVTNRTPEELLNKAGYDLYECHSEEDIQRFKKFYNQYEELCTFRGGRLDNCHVFFAVKKNVDQIKRENFSDPKREDEYGTSVISIQFTRGKTNTLSIKNRYNHTVKNPDATFSNNLENIIPGLTKSFERKYQLNIIQNKGEDFELTNYVQAKDGKFYRYNYEDGNIYYCPNNIIIDNFEPIKLEPEKYILFDNFVLDLEYKIINLYDELTTDSFVDGIKNIENIVITKANKNGNKEIKIITKDKNTIIIEIDKLNRLIGYKNEKLTKVGPGFLCFNETLENLELPNLVKASHHFLTQDQKLLELNLPKLKELGNQALYHSINLKELNLPNLISVGDDFLCNNKELTYLKLPLLRQVGNCFIEENQKISNIDMPNLVNVGFNFLTSNQNLTFVYLPNLIEVGTDFINHNHTIATFIAPNLKKVGHCFLEYNRELTSLKFPNLIKVETSFLWMNKKLSTFDAPKLETVGSYFLFKNENLTYLELPSLVSADCNFLRDNEELETFIAPKLIEVGSSFLSCNKAIVSLNLPSLIQARDNFLRNNRKLSKLVVPNLVHAGDGFLENNRNLSILEAPNLKTIGFLSATFNRVIRKIYYINKQQDDLYKSTIADVSKETVEHKKEKSKVRCKNGK